MSAQATSMAASSRNSESSTLITDMPVEEVEVMRLICAISRSSASTFSVTSASTRAGSAPG